MRLLFALVLWLLPALAAAATWSVVEDETWVEVDVKYRGMVVTMHFDTVRGNILFDEKRPQTARASIAVGTRDVTTGFFIADRVVRSKDYLNVDQYPRVDFWLDKLVRTSDSTADIFGHVRFWDVEQPVTLKATVFRYGPNADAGGRFDAGFTLSGEIDRTEFGHTTGLPQVAAVLPIRIHLLMRSDTPVE
jgi:polyisoprenoid-binding protein YceI